MNQVFLLLGPEEGEKSVFIKNRITEIKNRITEKPEIHRFYPFDSNMVDIIAVICNRSLFSKYKIVLLYNVEEIKKPKDVSVLADYLSRPVDEVTLFLLSSSVADISRKIEKKITRENKIIFWEMFDDKKIKWIMNLFRQRKIRIDLDAAEFLLEMIQNNTRDLKQECIKLAGFFGEGSHLKIDTIDKYIYHSKEENVFTLFEKIASRDFPASHEVLSKILLSKDTEAASLLGGLLWQVNRLLNLKRLLNKNQPLHDVFSKLSLKNKKSQKVYLTAHKKYSKGEVEALILLITEFDKRSRSMSNDLQKLLLQLVIYYSTVRGGMLPQKHALDCRHLR